MLTLLTYEPGLLYAQAFKLSKVKHNSASKRERSEIQAYFALEQNRGTCDILLCFIRRNFCFHESGTQLYKELKMDRVTFDPSVYKKSYNFVSGIKGVLDLIT